MKKDEPILTVVTTTYNHEKYIEECLKNVVSQKTDFKFLMLVSDDCSTDNTRNIIEKFHSKYPKIIVPIYHKTNLGAMENFIETLNMVHTEYVALCDGDDYWTDNSKLQQQVDFLRKNKAYNICFHKTNIFFEDNSQIPVDFPTKCRLTTELGDLLKENYIPANTVVYRWKYRKNNSFIKEFPKNIVPGDYFVHLVHAKQGKIHFINKTMSNYRRQSNGMWWLSCKKDHVREFYNIYGEKFLNFYNAVEKKLHLSKKILNEQKEYIIMNTIIADVRFMKFFRLRKLYKSEYKNYMSAFTNAYKSLGKKGKLYYKFVIKTCIIK